MNRGKAKCEKLKAIRRAIAEANNIEYHLDECTFEGDCDGTCPKCDAELEHLYKLLSQKEAMGEKISMPSIGIDDNNPYGTHGNGDEVEASQPEEIILGGMPALFNPDDFYEDDDYPLAGDIIFEEDPCEDSHYDGDSPLRGDVSEINGISGLGDYDPTIDCDENEVDNYDDWD